MNNVIRNTPMKYSFKNGKFKAKGYIDIFDFQGNKALASIAQKYFALHQGKTWNSDKIGFTTQVHFR